MKESPLPLSDPAMAESSAKYAERDATLRLQLIPGIGPRVFENLISQFGSAEKVLDAAPAELRNVTGVSQRLAREIALSKTDVDIQPTLELCQQHGIEILDQTHERYPMPLKEIYDPPTVLFSHGELLPIDALAIAIVGSRHGTHYGLTAAENLAGGLASAGFTIVSGLARGIDAAAHRGALKSGGRTVAVLGSGVLNMYPSEHKKLAAEIREQGAVVSESLPLNAPKPGCFPRRNRIVTGMSLGVIVVEASGRSGALISARLANEQGREVFAVPGRIDNRMSSGCHRLIRDGAKLIENVDDVLEELGPLAIPAVLGPNQTVRHPAELKLSDQETTVLNVIETSPTEFDQIVIATGLPPARILSTISVLEIRRLVRRLNGTQFVRV